MLKELGGGKVTIAIYFQISNTSGLAQIFAGKW